MGDLEGALRSGRRAIEELRAHVSRELSPGANGALQRGAALVTGARTLVGLAGDLHEIGTEEARATAYDTLLQASQHFAEAAVQIRQAPSDAHQRERLHRTLAQQADVEHALGGIETLDFGVRETHLEHALRLYREVPREVRPASYVQALIRDLERLRSE